MKFCNTCNNMFYLSIDPSECDKLMYYCRNCGTHDSNGITDKSSVISSVQLSNVETNMSRIVNKYTKLDPTLPRIDRIPCPNAECDTNVKQTPREIIYIRYDDINIKYMYLCSTCDYVWKASDA
jgi:DNA-directed RNA polymerase subunit M/transcription elongation factor TFIIS